MLWSQKGRISAHKLFVIYKDVLFAFIDKAELRLALTESLHRNVSSLSGRRYRLGAVLHLYVYTVFDDGQ